MKHFSAALGLQGENKGSHLLFNSLLFLLLLSYVDIFLFSPSNTWCMATREDFVNVGWQFEQPIFGIDVYEERIFNLILVSRRMILSL